MEDENFLNKMENLKIPDVNPEASRRQAKLAIMNAKKSAFWGVWFLAIPAFFFVCIIIKELLGWHWGIADTLTIYTAAIDRNASTAWITPVVFVLLPAIGAVTNLLAIMHFTYDKLTKELIVTIKTKWLNITIAIISLAILGMVLLYGIMETAAERAIHKYEQQTTNNKP
jgi:hypothetical protein